MAIVPDIEGEEPDVTVLARDVMSPPEVTVNPAASLDKAWRIMANTGVRYLAVETEGRCAGVAEERFIMREWLIDPASAAHKQVKDVVHPPTLCVRPDAPLQEVAAIMAGRDIDIVPVIGEHNELLGVVTRGDVADVVGRYGLTVPR